MKILASEAIRRHQEAGIRASIAVGGHRIADSYMKVASEDAKSPEERYITAQLLDNFGKIMDSELGNSFMATHAKDFGPYVMEVWPLVTAWYSDFPLKELISVQPMDKPLAYLFFSCLKAATSKSPQSVGDVVETALGSRVLKGRYPTGEIFGEEITKAQVHATNGTLLAYAPLNVAVTPGYLEKTQIVILSDAATPTETVYQAFNTANGKILFKQGTTEQADTVIALDINTGALTGTAIVATAAYTTNTGTVIKANYVWNLDYADTENIQKVKEQVEMVPCEATPRALALEWTLFSEYLKKTQFGVDIREDNTKRILNLLYQYQVRYILDEMYMYRDQTANPDVTVTVQTSTGIALEVINQRAQNQLKNIGGKILVASGRMEGNRLVVGLDFKNWLESLPSNMFKPEAADDAFLQTPRKIGKYGTYDVYYDPELAANKFWMTYRGGQWYDAAYYLGEYMPITPTDCIALAVTVRTSFVSMESYKYHKKNCVIGGTFATA
jgi:hypothetical protein